MDMARERAPAPDEVSEQQEYDFGRGALEALDRILALYEKTDRDLVVVINGSGINVGKTKLEQFLRSHLMERDIPTNQMSHLTRDELKWRQDHSPEPVESRRPYRVFFHTMHGGLAPSVPAFHAMHKTSEYLPADYFVAIYRPDRPFSKIRDFKPLGDIVIRNEKAIDSPYKFSARSRQ